MKYFLKRVGLGFLTVATLTGLVTLVMNFPIITHIAVGVIVTALAIGLCYVIGELFLPYG